MYKNILEDIVEAMVDRVIADEGCCSCPICRSDVCAIALNKLKPKYVNSEAGDIFETKCAFECQNQVEIYTVLLNAAHRVKQAPRCAKPQCGDGDKATEKQS